jgi:tetratricopeptide (TPR) repeat protein
VVKPLVTVQTELTRINPMLYSNDFKNARTELMKINRAFPNNADVNNLLGYTSRKLKLYSSSATYYTKALQINPNHLGALEYQGELFVITKKIASAKSNLAKLLALCGADCGEYQDLKKVIGNKK